MWWITAGLLAGGVLCVGLALWGGPDLGYALTAPCSTAAYCDQPGAVTLISGAGTTDLALWTPSPPENTAPDGVWARLIDARSGAPEGATVRVASAPAPQGVAGLYNAASRRYLILWQDGSEVSGQLLDSRLRPVGRGFGITGHDSYLRPADLAAGPDGSFLFTEVRNPDGPPGVLPSSTQVFATRINSSGQAAGATSWTVSDESEPLERAEVHAVYVPTAHHYLVGWSLFGASTAILADRVLDASGKPSATVNTLMSGPDAAGTSFALAYQPADAGTRVVWLQRSGAGVSLVGVNLDHDGAPSTATGSLGQLNPLVAEDPVPLSDDLTLTPTAHEEIALWQLQNLVDAFAIPVKHAAPATVTSTTLQGVEPYAVAANPETPAIAVLSSSDHGYRSQLYASAIPLDH